MSSRSISAAGAETSRLPCFRAAGKPAERGSSLLEVMIAVLIVSIVSVAMSVFFARGRFMFDQEEHKRVGTLIAQQALERAKGMNYADVAAWSDTLIVANITYDLAVSVQTGAPAADMKTVRAVTTWQVRPTVERSVSLATLLYDK